MMRTLSMTLALAIAIAAPAGADLRYTTHVEARKVPATGPPDPLLGILGGMLMNLMASGDTTTIIGANGARVEIKSAIGPIPAGAAILLRIGSAVVINPQDQTYWTLPGVPGGTLALMDPQMVSKRTGEFTMVAGLRAERSAYSVTLNLPLPANVQLPLPKTLTMDGEMWVTNEYKTYASTLADVTTVAVPGISVGIFGGSAEGLIVRQITRSALLGFEIEYTVSDIVEGPAASDLFQVPAGYREVPPPTTNLPR